MKDKQNGHLTPYFFFNSSASSPYLLATTLFLSNIALQVRW